MNNELSFLSQELELRKDETIGTFGEIDLGYDEMYQSLYMVDSPELLSEVVSSIADEQYNALPENERHGKYQFFWYDALEEICDECSLDYNEISVNLYENDIEVVYLVNYKGEGEGYFIYSEVKNKIAGKYIAKYNYQ